MLNGWSTLAYFFCLFPYTPLSLAPGSSKSQEGLESGDIVKVESPYGKIYGRIGTAEGWHPDALGVSNSLSRIKVRHDGVPHAGGHFNDMLPYDLRNTDAVTGQPETVCRVKITKLDDWPEGLKLGLTVYDLVDDIQKPGKGRSH